MFLRDRSDGKRSRAVEQYNAIMPYLMRRRNESAVYFANDIDVENAIKYIKRRNAELGENKFSLFGLVLAAAARTLALKPRLNRFVHRRGIYDRNEIAFSFIVKKRLTEEAAESNAKIIFEPEDTIDVVMDRFNAAVESARGNEPAPDDKEIHFLKRIPGGMALFTFLFRLLDRLNLAPKRLIDNDPFYASGFFANLGSIGLETPYHHLYEWGTVSFFMVLGRMTQRDVPRQGGGVSRRHFINFKITLDERIADGIYFAHASSLFSRFIAHPELLEEPTNFTMVED
jgi:hypothetical protein